MAADRGKSMAGATVQLELRRSAAADDLDVAPEHTLRMTGAERFHRRLFRREPSGEMDGGLPSPHAVRDLPVGKEPLSEPLAIPFDRGGDSRDVGSVDSKADDIWHDQKSLT